MNAAVGVDAMLLLSALDSRPMDGPSRPLPARRNQALLWSGVVATVVGAVLLLYGAWPLGYTLELLKGPGSDPEAVGANVEAMMAEAKARVWADVLGFVLLLAGMTMVPMSKPKPRPVEELVEEALQRRAASGGPPATANLAAPSRAAAPSLPPAPLPQPPPDSPPSAAPVPRCPTCASLLVAGGRICPKGHV